MRTLLACRKQVEVSQPVRACMDETLNRFATGYAKLNQAHVTLDRERAWFKADIRLLGKRTDIEASATATDLLAAVNQALGRAERQLRRRRDRVQQRSSLPRWRLELEAPAVEP